MDSGQRAELTTRALAGYVNGPGAPIEATERALRRIKESTAIIVVEGISDQIAIETLAFRRGRDLDAEGVVVLLVGGAHAVMRHLRDLGPGDGQRSLAGFCDAGEAEAFRRGLTDAGVGHPASTSDMARLGFHGCVRDLEDELIRAVGTDGVEVVLDMQGDLGSFRTLQKQPQWRGRPTGDQLHRFFGSGARRKLRYARLLVEAVELDRVPRPLDAVLGHV